MTHKRMTFIAAFRWRMSLRLLGWAVTLAEPEMSLKLLRQAIDLVKAWEPDHAPVNDEMQRAMRVPTQDAEGRAAVMSENALLAALNGPTQREERETRVFDRMKPSALLAALDDLIHTSAELQESVAILMADGNSDGQWDSHYTEEQREVWRQKAAQVIEMVRAAR
jgi:hypothetical protein